MRLREDRRGRLAPELLESEESVLACPEHGLALLNEGTHEGAQLVQRGPGALDVLLEGERELRTLLEVAAENDEGAEDEAPKERVQVGRAHGHGSGYAAGRASPPWVACGRDFFSMGRVRPSTSRWNTVSTDLGSRVARTSIARALALISALAVLTATGGSGWQTARNDGVAMRYPPGWFATTRRLTPVDWPRQVLAVSSYPFPRDTSPNGCAPAGRLGKMPPAGALIVVIEYTYTPSMGFPTGLVDSRRFPAQPAHFRLGSARRYECLGPRRSYRLLFREKKRFFQVGVAFGTKSGATERATVLRVLDSFDARPR